LTDRWALRQLMLYSTDKASQRPAVQLLMEALLQDVVHHPKPRSTPSQ
jgi:hypothetical protein